MRINGITSFLSGLRIRRTTIAISPDTEFFHRIQQGNGFIVATVNDSDLREQALARLPHGPEFRFLHRLLELEPGRSGTGECEVRGTEPFLKGHFPGEPIFPGVLLVEAAAQLAGVVAQSDPTLPPLPGLRLTALRSVKILGAARPGETIRLQAQITGRLGNLVQAEVQAELQGNPILEAQLTLSGQSSEDGPAAGQ